MSEFTELNFRENHAYKYFDIYSAAENLGSEYFKNESEVFYEVKKKNFGLAALILMSLSGSVYAEAPLTDSTVINGNTTINVDTGANSGINLSGNKEISLAASASDAAVTIKVNGQKSVGDVRYGIRVSNGAKINLSDLDIVSEDKTGDVNGIYASASEININNLNVDVNGNSIYGVNIYNGSQMNVAGNMTIAVKGDTVPSSGIRGYSKFGQRRVERTGRFNY